MKHLLLLISSAFLLFSCKEDTTPAWIEIPDFQLNTVEAIHGVNSHGISDAWVYMDGDALGVFELPARIPILAEGQHEFIIIAGVKNYGMNSRRIKYPFFKSYTTSLNLIKGETILVNPIITYKDEVTLALLEDFEDTGIEFTKTNISDTSLVFIEKSTHPEIVKYGLRCGGIFLTETDSIFKAATSTFLDLPKGGEDVFMEMDFLCNNSCVMGVIAQNSGATFENTPLAEIFPHVNLGQSEWFWRKIYIDLKDDVNQHQNATSYEVYLLSVLDPANTFGEIYLDNIKIVRYE